MDDNSQKEPILMQDPLSLEIEDEELVDIIGDKLKNNEAEFEKKYHLKDRREKNEKYYLGEQIDTKKLKDYEGKWLDNVIWESERQLKAISVSKMPDFIVTPGVQGEEAQKIADDISKVIDARSKTRERRQVLTMAFKREPLDFFGTIKWLWNPELGEHGDIEYKWVLGEDIVLDAFSNTNEATGMDIIGERLHCSLKEMIVRFPDKENDILEEAKKDGLNFDKYDKPPEKGLATIVHPWEVWFTWYNKVGDKWERIEGVAWKYHKKILHKMKDPNWDWGGEKRLFSYKELLTEEKVRESVLSNQPMAGMREEKVYRNYFKNPEKPYIFMCSDLLGKSPISVTSRIEQLILMQYSLDDRGKVIQEKLANRVKHIFSKETGLKADDIEEMDLNDPDEDLLVDGDINKTHGVIPPDLPTAQEFKDYEDTRNRMFAKGGTNATRGEIQSDTATSNQIAREGNFALDDNLVDETITYAAEKMVRADLQLTKLRRSEEDFTEVLGEDGKSTFYKFQRDMINDGMVVISTASGTDKLKAERRAIDLAKLKLIDPHTFYKDIGASDPMGRTMKLMMFLQSPAEYTAKYGLGLQDSQAMGNKLNGENGQQAILDIQQLQQGQQPNVPQSPTPEYIDTLNKFIQSPEFQALNPQIQQIIVQFAKQVIDKTSGATENPPSNQFGQGGETNNPPANPTPTNTSAMPTEPPTLPSGSTRNL
jgi:hypothetical protein